MKNKTKSISKKILKKQAFKKMISLRALIAVVAIIECLILVVFTTYSWIETNSSLIIKNGPSSNVELNNTSLDIAKKLTYKIDLDQSSNDWSNLNRYFSSVKYFEFAKTTSPDGRMFYFPRKNNTHPGTTEYRRGDTDDYNTSYLFFDFMLSNKAANAENYDIYFDETSGFADIFTVTGDFTDLNGHTAQEYRDALKGAMRMSITTRVSNATPVTNIYSADGNLYHSVNKTNPDPEQAADHPEVSPSVLSDYVYSIDENNIVRSKKLFLAKKNAETRVSIRVWFEEGDATFQSVFGYNNSGYYNTDVYKSISKAKVGVKFKLKACANDLRALYFDDYTFSNAANVAHITDENSNYSVWFYAYQPHVDANNEHPERPAAWVATEMVPDRSNSEFTRWWTTDTTVTMMENLRSGTQYQNCYFCYGDFSTKTAVYRWALPSAPVENAEYIFNAYSYDPNSSVTNNTAWNTSATTAQNCNGTFKNGVGLWQDEGSYTTVKLLKFNDLATGITTGAFNASVSGSPNLQFMNAKAETDNHSHYLIFANNKKYSTSFDANASTTVNVVIGETATDLSLWSSAYTAYGATHGKINETNAAMYYDENEEMFMSYVPSFWLTGDNNNGANKGVTFDYTPTGTFSQNATTQQWYSAMPQLSGDEYIFTALGYTNAYNNNCYVTEYGKNGAAFFTGVGTWGKVEKISFCTDLIDSDLSSAYRYMIGVSGYSSSNAAWDYYAMIPDETNMTFSAFVPVGLCDGEGEEGQISFARYASVSTHTPGAYWYGNRRYTSSTFYPVDLTETTYRTSGYVYTHGYWNLSVLVDGTYENLIYTSLTDGATGNAGNSYFSSAQITDPDATIDYSTRINFGKLEYSYDGATNWQLVADDLDGTFNNKIDRYRFYAPAEGHSVVFWRWTPYAGYTITLTTTDPETEETVETETVVNDTVFDYSHDTETGIYKLVTEAKSKVNMNPSSESQEEPEP